MIFVGFVGGNGSLGRQEHGEKNNIKVDAEEM
jgi:hypothetical protein